MSSTPNTNALAFQRNQFMSDYRKIEEIMAKIKKERRNSPTESEKVFLRAVLNRLPANKRAALEPIFDQLLEL